MPSEITFRNNCIRARVSFDMQPCLLCAGLVTSYLSKWSTGTSCQSFCKTASEYMASGVTLPPLRARVMGGRRGRCVRASVHVREV